MALRTISYYGAVTPIDQIEQNIIWYLRDELLQLGAYYNITSGFLGYNGENWATMRPSYQPEHSNFQFWAGRSHQWVWESGLDTSTVAITNEPIQPSGIYVSGVFYPTATETGRYEHYIDYNRGGVVFTNAIPSGLNFYCERSERVAFIYSAHSSEYRKIMYDHFRVLSSTPGSGLDNYTPENKVFLPAIFVGCRKSRSTPYELGNLVNFTNYRVNFDVFAEHTFDFNKLRDICNGLEAYPLPMFDVNTASASGGVYPLNHLGQLRSEAQTRSQLITNYFWKSGHFSNSSTERILPQILPLQRARISLEFELVL